jgi:hypothetical protein
LARIKTNRVGGEEEPRETCRLFIARLRQERLQVQRHSNIPCFQYVAGRN